MKHQITDTKILLTKRLHVKTETNVILFERVVTLFEISATLFETGVTLFKTGVTLFETDPMGIKGACKGAKTETLVTKTETHLTKIETLITNTTSFTFILSNIHMVQYQIVQFFYVLYTPSDKIFVPPCLLTFSFFCLYRFYWDSLQRYFYNFWDLSLFVLLFQN